MSVVHSLRLRAKMALEALDSGDPEGCRLILQGDAAAILHPFQGNGHHDSLSIQREAQHRFYRLARGLNLVAAMVTLDQNPDGKTTGIHVCGHATAVKFLQDKGIGKPEPKTEQGPETP